MLIEIVGGYFTYFYGNKYNVGPTSPPQTRYSKYIDIIECNHCIRDCYFLSVTHWAMYKGTWSEDPSAARTGKIGFLIRIKWGQIGIRVGALAIITWNFLKIKWINRETLIIVGIIETKKEENEDKMQTSIFSQ